MIYRITLVAIMAHFGLFPWVASSIFAGETKMPDWLAWDLIALFVLALAWTFTGFLLKKPDGEQRLLAFIALLSTVFVTLPAMIDRIDDDWSSWVMTACGGGLLLLAIVWAVLAKPTLKGGS